MKNIIIAGTCRAGKTLLTQAIKRREPKYNVLSGDLIRKALYDTFTKDYVAGKHNYLWDFFVNLSNLYGGVKAKFPQYDEQPFIFESTDFVHEAILQAYNENTIIIFIGKPNLTGQQWASEIRESEKKFKSWTARHSDEELLEKCNQWVKQAQEDVEFCKKHGFLYCDTSFNQMDTLEKFADELTKTLIN